MDLLLNKAAVVTLAILGGLLSTAASFLQMRGHVSEKTGRVINYAGYALMAVSMLLFVVAGLLR